MTSRAPRTRRWRSARGRTPSGRLPISSPTWAGCWPGVPLIRTGRQRCWRRWPAGRWRGSLARWLAWPPDAGTATAACGLRMDQAAAAFHVLTSGRRVEVIVGPAGSGKAHVLAAIGRVWPHGRVVGVTPSQSSRDVLAEAGVTQSYNFAQFLGHLKDERGARGPVRLGPGDLIAIDEASMLSSPDLGDIVDYAARSGAKVVMALDHQQLQAVENGGGASLITRTQGYVQLPQPVRFSEEWERSASLGLRAGKISALADY